jgi:predicted ribonuclease YlaK
MKFYDTNALLELMDDVLVEPFVISSVTLEELENIKTSKTKTEEVRYKARKVVHLLDENRDKYEVVIYTDSTAERLHIYAIEVTNDSKICSCAKEWQRDNRNDELLFVTNDICCRVIAEDIFGLKVERATSTDNSIYKGYKSLIGDTEYINTKLTDESYVNSFVINEYVLIHNTDTKESSEMRFDGKEFVPLKLPSSKYIKAKNALQRCALDMLNNPNITACAVLGGYGSGKSFLSMQMALYAVQEKGWQSKIVGVREPIGEGCDVGYLKGDFEEKTDNFFLPLVQQLNGGEFELEKLKQTGVLESTIPFYLKGQTFPNTVMLVDEAEDLSDKQIRLVGTRVGENSKIIFDGDYKQAVGNNSKTNPLVRMCNELKGNEKFACIYLDEDVRSSTSKMFAQLFEN